MQAKEDAEALKGWFLEQEGEQSPEDFSVLSAFPLEFLKLAEENGKGASFVPKGRLQVSPFFNSDTHLHNACKVHRILAIKYGFVNTSFERLSVL